MIIVSQALPFLLVVITIGGFMYIVVGLGNPSSKYKGTRHNMGFDAIDNIADRNSIDVSSKKFKGVYGKGVIQGQKVVLLKPETYMNLSGESVRAAVDFFKINPEDELIVLYDDISLAPGKLRLRAKGSAGGHNGIKNIIAHLGTEKFKRVKIGVGEKPAGMDLADYVLGRFDKIERITVDKGIDDAARAVEIMIAEGIDKAMNMFN